MNNPIRILQLFTIMGRAGAETNIMNYYRKLDRNKFQFDFIVHRKEIGDYEPEIIELGGKITRFLPFNPFKTKAYKKQISDFFDNNSYQIIHGNCSELGYYIYKEASLRQVPVIIAHGHNATDGWNLKSPFRWYYKKRMMKYVNTYFSCGYEASVWLFGKEKAKQAFIMNNAIDSQKFEFNHLQSIDIKNQLNANSTLNILNVGRFSIQKNHAFLIDVFNELLKINNNYKLYLVGEGALKKDIEKKVQMLNIQNNVVFLGLRDNVNEILQAMDFFLFPSLFEGLPVSLVEAQAAGLKCYISDKVPQESILIPENVQTIRLSKSAEHWAKEIALSSNFIKDKVSNLIIDKNYDIETNIVKLQNKFIELLQIKS